MESRFSKDAALYERGRRYSQASVQGFARNGGTVNVAMLANHDVVALFNIRLGEGFLKIVRHGARLAREEEDERAAGGGLIEEKTEVEKVDTSRLRGGLGRTVASRPGGLISKVSEEREVEQGEQEHKGRQQADAAQELRNQRRRELEPRSR